MTLRGFLTMVRRRKGVLLMTLILLPAISIGLSLRQPKLYQASARVLLSSQNLANQVVGISGGSVVEQQPDRVAQTQASVARTTAVAQRVLAKVPGTGLTPGQFLGESGASPNPNADILIFTVTNSNPGLARRLVNEYAAQYTIYRHELERAPVALARDKLRATMKKLAATGGTHSSFYSSLEGRDQTLATLEALQTSNATVIQSALGAGQTQPRTKRDAILAAILGLLLGLAFAALWETLDTRVRTANDIAKYLGGVPSLAHLPAPSRDLQFQDRLVMMAEPNQAQAEPFRLFRTNLDFVMLDRDVRMIMVTSAMAGEGKSTTIANLAVALARSGQRVILVDLDLRRPRLDRFFDLKGPGVTQVALGRVSLETALVRIMIPGPLRGYVNQYRVGGDRGSLHVLPAGTIPPDRGSFFDSQALNSILEVLRQQADIVLIDAPPALEVGDAMILSQKVDAILLVARVNLVRRPKLHELAQLLAMTPARVLGFIATGAEREKELVYGYRTPTPPGDERVDLDLELGRATR